MKQQRMRLVVRWSFITASLSALLFLAAGTTQVASIRHYLAVFSAWLLITMVTVNPRLAEERAHPKDASIEEASRFAAGLLFLLTLSTAAFSVGHLRTAFNTPIPIRHAALGLFALSGSLQTWSMIVNPFFSPVIRLQPERGHRVIAHGPYQFMRHPGYFAMSMAIPASALAVGSWIALIPAIGFVFVILRRVSREDKFLGTSLPGYVDYVKRVPPGFIRREAPREDHHKL
jgi:protein-S-isoprenylcysteine O-methyltransferase Ste14